MFFISNFCRVKKKNTVQVTGHVVFGQKFDRHVEPTTVSVRCQL